MGFAREPRITAIDLQATIAGRAEVPPVVALAGGGLYKGWRCACAVVWKNTKPEEPNPSPVERPFGLSEYVASASAIVEGDIISRRAVIRYMSNVRGGVHLGTAKSRRQEKAFTSRIAALESAVNILTVHGLLYELVSIGQAVAQAPDSTLLIETFRHRKVP